MLIAIARVHHIFCKVGDGRLGYAGEGPYDAIHVGAAAAQIPQAVCVKLLYTK